MICPKCNSSDVNIQVEQVAAKTKNKGVGLGGHINNIARGTTALITLGASNLVWKKATGTEQTKFKNKKICLCQNCGYSWNI